MYARTRNTREHWNAVTDASPSALVGAGATVVLIPIAVTYLVVHPALGGTLLLGIALAALLSRLDGPEAGAHPESEVDRPSRPAVWFEGLAAAHRTSARTRSE